MRLLPSAGAAGPRDAAGIGAGVIATSGEITGARTASGRLQEVFVRPGSSVAFVSDQGGQEGVKVTESARRTGIAGAAPVAAGQAASIRGIALGPNGTVQAIIYGRAPAPLQVTRMLAAGEQEERPIGREQSPVQGRPYLQVMTGRPGGSNAVAAGETVQLAGSGQPGGGEVEVAVDGKPAGKLAVGQDGRFSGTVRAPWEPGLHTVTVRDPASGQVIDGASFLVRLQDVRDRDEGRARGRGGRSEPK